jgi:hypothetical protein
MEDGDGYLHGGLFLEGLAITKPEPAPETQAPLGPMLHKIPLYAIGDSLSMKD